MVSPCVRRLWENCSFCHELKPTPGMKVNNLNLCTNPIRNVGAMFKIFQVSVVSQGKPTKVAIMSIRIRGRAWNCLYLEKYRANCFAESWTPSVEARISHSNSCANLAENFQTSRFTISQGWSPNIHWPRHVYMLTSHQMVVTSNIQSTKKNVMKIIHPPAAYLQDKQRTERK